MRVRRPLPKPADARNLAQLIDHTLLKPEATPAQIEKLCDEALEFGFKGVCVNPCYVALAARRLAGTPALTMAVVGFPLGATRTDVKVDEALRAVQDGAGELDMVINAGMYLGGERTAARHDVAAVVRAAGKVPVKVILETGLLTTEQIREWCGIVADAGGAFVKTSTGFGPRGATKEDIETMFQALTERPQLGIKASGGVRTLDQALVMVAAGATRFGSSGSVQIVKDFAARS